MDRTAHILTLLNKYQKNDISIDELRTLQRWATTHPAYGRLMEEFSPESDSFSETSDSAWSDYLASGNSISFENLLHRIALQKNKTRKKYITWLSAAASIVLIGVFSFYFSHQQADHNLHGEVVMPGSKKAVLLADNGLRQEIADERGLVITEKGMFYSDGQAIAEDILLATQQLKLIVPKGGEYQITLADGTTVWLNSNSTLRFPQEFSSEKRLVEISGEAYFEVTHDSKRPFIVKSDYQEITVLGTAFNVKAYTEDELNTTTLIEGLVQVRGNDGDNRFELHPGQAAIAGKSQQLKIQPCDVEQVISWKKGEFNFSLTPFEEVAKQIARWYDLDVEYKNKIPQEYFTGQLSRTVDFEIVLAFLKDSGINVESVSNKLIIH